MDKLTVWSAGTCNQKVQIKTNKTPVPFS